MQQNARLAEEQTPAAGSNVARREQGQSRNAAQSGTAGDRSGIGVGQAGRGRAKLAVCCGVSPGSGGRWQADLGYMVPPVRVTDNLQLRSGEYVVLLKGAEVARFEMMQNCELAIHPGGSAPPLEGIATKEPAFGIQALWIPSEKADHARSQGYTVVDAVSVLGHAFGRIDPPACVRIALASGH